MARSLILPGGEKLSVDANGSIVGRDNDGALFSRLQFDILMVRNSVAINQWLAAEAARLNRDPARQLLEDLDVWAGLARLADKPAPPKLRLGSPIATQPTYGRISRQGFEAAPGHLDRLARHRLAHVAWVDTLDARRLMRLSELETRRKAEEEIRGALQRVQPPGHTRRANLLRHALEAADWPTTVTAQVETVPDTDAVTVVWHAEVDTVLHVLAAEGTAFERRSLEADRSAALRRRHHLAVTIAIGLVLFAVDESVDVLEISGTDKPVGGGDILYSGAHLSRPEAAVLLHRQRSVLIHAAQAAMPDWFMLKDPADRVQADGSTAS